MSSNIARGDISRAGIIFLQGLQLWALLECGFYSREGLIWGNTVCYYNSCTWAVIVVIIVTNKVHTMFAFCVPINKTQSVPNWGINAWNTLSAASNTPRNDTSQNKSGTSGISLKTELLIRKHKTYFVHVEIFAYWQYLEEFNLSQ